MPAPAATSRAPVRVRGGIGMRLLLALVVSFAMVALAWMLFLPAIITEEVRSRTGFDIAVQALAANPFTGELTVRGLVVNNPPTFRVPEFVQLRELRASGEFWSLFGDKLVLDRLVLDVGRVALVRRADGVSNAEAFARGLGLGGPTAAQVSASMTSPGPSNIPVAGTRPAARRYYIKRLTLRFDQLTVADYTGGGVPVVQEYRIGLNQSYDNVSDTKQLLVPAALKTLGPALAPLGALVPGDFGRALGDAAKTAAHNGSEALQDAGRKTESLFKGLFEKLEEKRKP